MNKKIILLVIFILVLLTISYLYNNSRQQPSESFISYSNNPDPMAIDKNSVKLVLFYAPWCGHCKALMPDWEKIEYKYNNQVVRQKKITISKIDCDQNAKLAEQYNIQGYPTIKLLHSNNNGKINLYDYEDQRNYNQISKFINLMASK